MTARPSVEAGPAEQSWLGGVERWSGTHAWLPDALLALATVAVLGTLSVSGGHGMHWSTGWTAAVVAAFVVLHLTVAVRRRVPLIAYALGCLAMLTITLAPDARLDDPAAGGPDHLSAVFLPSTLVFLILLYTVSARLPALRSRVALVVAMAGAVLVAIRMSTTVAKQTSGGWLLWAYVGLGLAVAVLATWGLGRSSLARRERAVLERAEVARLAVLEERARIAREMHDIVAHSLAVIVRQAEGGAYVAARDPEQAARSLQTIARTGRDALTDMRGLLRVLHDPADSATSTVTASQPTLADLPELMTRLRDTGFEAELTESGEPFAVGAATELAVFRLAQEGLTNAVKYAGPGARVAISLRWHPTDLAVEVTDEGGEPDPQLPVPGAGAGLQGLRDRVAAVGGTFTATPHERGFLVRAQFPRPAGEGDR